MSKQTIFNVFVDYDNLLHAQKTAGTLDVVTKALIQIPLDNVATRAKCDVRIYGGWYEGNQITRLAEDIAIQIQRDFPAIIRLPKGKGDYINVSTTAELAVALLQEPGHHLFNTYRKKGRPSNIRVQAQSNVGCADPDCVLPLMKKLISNGNCPKQGCGVTASDLVYRHEQKIVDTMLSCDLIHAANEGANKIILVSGDDDFIPPLRTILLHGADVVRFHPKHSNQRAAFPHGGAQLREMEL